MEGGKRINSSGFASSSRADLGRQLPNDRISVVRRGEECHGLRIEVAPATAIHMILVAHDGLAIGIAFTLVPAGEGKLAVGEYASPRRLVVGVRI